MNRDGIVPYVFSLKKEFTRFFLAFALLIFIGFFYGMNHRFLTYANIMNILRDMAVMAMMAMAAMFVMMVGELNFGLGAEATLAAALLGWLCSKNWIPGYIAGFALTILFMMAVAFVNSRFTCYLGVPAFIATLAASKLWDAMTYRLTGGQTFYSSNWDASFTAIGQGYSFGIPNIVIGMIIMIAFGWIVLEKTRLGRHIQASGGNTVAALQVGIPVRRVKCIAFFLSALFSAVAGIFLCSKTGNVLPTMGSNIMMDAICAAMLGATFWRIGRFNIPGTLVAAGIMAVISNGLTTMGASDWMQYVIQGIMLTIAVGYIAITREEGLPGVKMT